MAPRPPDVHGPVRLLHGHALRDPGPGRLRGLLRLLFDYDTAEELFPLVLVSLVVPIALLAVPRTRRFGIYMVLGMVLTALVVLGVASLVLYYLVKHGKLTFSG